MKPSVSIIIPCYNEGRYIDGLMENLRRQDYPSGQVEIIIADGLSTDDTRARLDEWKKVIPGLSVIDNPDRFVPHALNLALKQAKGEVIIRMDAHSVYPENYISVLTERLFGLNADNVGGVWITEPGADTPEARAIALATSHPLGIGNASYRTGAVAEREADTVPYGCFRRSVFERWGYFDTDLLRNQDDEFNGRIRKNGGHIWLIPSVHIRYFARPTRSTMARMFYQYGLYKPLVNIKLGAPATLRQFAPPMMVAGLLTGLILCILFPALFIYLNLAVLLYVLPVMIVSGKLSRGTYGVYVHLLLTFPSIHFSYGIGYLHGLVRFVLLSRHRKTKQTLADNR